MSHFSVIVIGPNVEKQLAPYHEFECTGRDDEYVQTLDTTEEARKKYEEDIAYIVRFPDGSTVNAYDHRFYRDPTPEEQAKIGPFGGTGGGNGLSWHSQDWKDGRGYRTKVRDVTLGGGVEEKVPTSTVRSFRDFLTDYYGRKEVLPGEQPDIADEHKYGYTLIDAAGEVVATYDRTNPNKRWDWYVVGGRWDGFFPVKRGGKVNVSEWGDVDIARARREAKRKAEEAWQKWADALAGGPNPESLATICGRHPGNMDAAREEYNAQPAIKAMRAWDCPVETYGFNRDAYIARCIQKALVPFAIVKDGQWYERGTMGWWGAVSGEQDHDTWAAKVAELFDGLPADTLVTIVDCHI